MLFTNLYTRIRYKLVPPSYNAKNRLFIERDSIKRKIINNGGLTFRNGKWANYERENVTPSFLLYWRTIGLLCLIISVGFYWSFHVSPLALGRYLSLGVYYSFWMVSDYMDYCSLLLIWAGFSVWTLLKRIFFSMLSYNGIIPRWGAFEEREGLTIRERKARVEEMRQTFRITHRFPQILFRSWEVFSAEWVTRTSMSQDGWERNKLPGLLQHLFQLQHSQAIVFPQIRTFTGIQPRGMLSREGNILEAYRSLNHMYGIRSGAMRRHWGFSQTQPLRNEMMRLPSSAALISSGRTWNYHSLANTLSPRIVPLNEFWNDLAQWRMTDKWIRSYSMLHRGTGDHENNLTHVKKGITSTNLNILNTQLNLWNNEILATLTNENSLRTRALSTIRGEKSFPSQTHPRFLESSLSFLTKRLFFLSTLGENERGILYQKREGGEAEMIHLLEMLEMVSSTIGSEEYKLNQFLFDKEGSEEFPSFLESDQGGDGGRIGIERLQSIFFDDFGSHTAYHLRMNRVMPPILLDTSDSDENVNTTFYSAAGREISVKHEMDLKKFRRFEDGDDETKIVKDLRSVMEEMLGEYEWDDIFYSGGGISDTSFLLPLSHKHTESVVLDFWKNDWEEFGHSFPTELAHEFVDELAEEHVKMNNSHGISNNGEDINIVDAEIYKIGDEFVSVWDIEEMVDAYFSIGGEDDELDSFFLGGGEEGMLDEDAIGEGESEKLLRIFDGEEEDNWVNETNSEIVANFHRNDENDEMFYTDFENEIDCPIWDMRIEAGAKGEMFLRANCNYFNPSEIDENVAIEEDLTRFEMSLSKKFGEKWMNSIEGVRGEKVLDMNLFNFSYESEISMDLFEESNWGGDDGNELGDARDEFLENNFIYNVYNEMKSIDCLGEFSENLEDLIFLNGGGDETIGGERLSDEEYENLYVNFAHETEDAMFNWDDLTRKGGDELSINFVYETERDLIDRLLWIEAEEIMHILENSSPDGYEIPYSSIWWEQDYTILTTFLRGGGMGRHFNGDLFRGGRQWRLLLKKEDQTEQHGMIGIEKLETKGGGGGWKRI